MFVLLVTNTEKKDFTGRSYCEQKGIELYFNVRDHRFSSSSLRREVAEKEAEKNKERFKSFKSSL